VVNTIQAGAAKATAAEWRKMAALGDGEYFRVDQSSGSAVAITTPYDEKLARLSEELDGTRLYYGDGETRAEKEAKLAATRKLHDAASTVGDNELVDDVASGRVDLDEISTEELPEPLQAMAAPAAKAIVMEKAEQRQKLQSEIRRLSQQRSDFLKKKVEESGGAKASLDDRLYGAVREQAATKGLKYDAAAPAY
jgi:hypothetical protein